MFSLDSLALRDTTELQLVHPVTEEPLFDGEKPVGLVLYGTASRQYRNAITSLQNRQLRRPKNAKVTAEALREESVNVLVACTASGLNLSYNDQPLDNADAIRELYNDPKFSWVKEQADAALGDVSRFLGQ